MLALQVSAKSKLMLYTRKGDQGTTKVINSKDRLSKSSALFEALGSIDEINSFLGLCKVKSADEIAKMIHGIQENLFIAQAELAGAPMSLSPAKVQELEAITDNIEKILPPIKTFFISGGTELAALFDTARTVARRAERRVVAAKEAEGLKISPDTLAYLNRLSSALYALARYANHQAGISELAPTYSKI